MDISVVVKEPEELANSLLCFPLCAARRIELWPCIPELIQQARIDSAGNKDTVRLQKIRQPVEFSSVALYGGIADALLFLRADEDLDERTDRRCRSWLAWLVAARELCKEMKSLAVGLLPTARLRGLPILDAVRGPAEMLSAIATFGCFIVPVLAASRVADKDGNHRSVGGSVGGIQVCLGV